MADSNDTPGKPSGPSPRKPAATNSTKAGPTSRSQSGPAKRATASKAATGGTANKAGSGSSNRTQARSRFNAAIDEARAGVAALRADAVERSSSYRRTAADSAATWADDARSMGEQARKRATEAAREGKTRASDGLAALGKTVSDTAGAIDERLGAQYGDYARSAARSLQEAAAKLDAKDIGELGEDAREFVRKSPGAAIGIAAVAGYFLARMFRGSDD